MARSLGAICDVQRVGARPPAASLTEQALRSPIGTLPLGRLASAGQKVLILCDDHTRATPAAELLPPVLAELREAGVSPEDVSILMALGTHRQMTRAELARKLGEEVLRQHPVIQHDWRREEDLVPLGETSAGLPIIANRRVLQADLVIGLGHVVPHRITGYSGGAKIVAPGVTGAPRTVAEIHWLGAQVPARDLLGVIDNPVRAQVNEMGTRVGLRFVVNAVQDADGRVAAIFAGDPAEAQRQAALASRVIYSAHLPELADVVVVDSYPAGADFWQAAKAAYAAEVAVRPGGVVILVAPCPEGVARHHPAVLEYGVRPVEEVRQLVASGEIEDVAAAAIMTLTAWVVRERATGIMVSPGIPPDDQRRLGFTPASTPQEALAMALEMVGRDGRVAALRHGGEIAPVVEAEAQPEVPGITWTWAGRRGP
jgi:nickel-dependent lactate racemase